MVNWYLYESEQAIFALVFNKIMDLTMEWNKFKDRCHCHEVNVTIQGLLLKYFITKKKIFPTIRFKNALLQ